MVHALRRAGQRLRPGGSLISIRPHRTFRPEVSLISPARRLPVTRLINAGFDTRLSAAEAAIARVVREGEFTLVGSRAQRYRSLLDNPSQVRAYLELITPPRPRFPPGSRARLRRLWAARAPGARIEIAESIVITALRRR